MNDTTKLAVNIPERAAKGWGQECGSDVLYGGRLGKGPRTTTHVATAVKLYEDSPWTVQITKLNRYHGGFSGGSHDKVYEFITHEAALDFAEKKLPKENRT